MFSLLPLLIIAIALTPIVASAGAAYKREVEEQNRQFSEVESNSIGTVELNN